MLVANRKNLKINAKDLLGNEWSEEKQKELIDFCTKNSPYDEKYDDGYSNFSFAVSAYMEDIDKILGTYGIENMYHSFGMNCGAELEYCNTGDTYALTLCWFNGKLYIADQEQMVVAARTTLSTQF